MTEQNPAAPTSAAELVDYQAGAIVSSTIIEGETGSVTLFAFGRDQALSEHTAPFDALVYVIDGQAEVSISGRAQRLRAGEMLVMPAGKPHAVRAPEPFKMMLVMIRA